MSDIPFKNPGWAGNTGDFDLTEDQVRGDDFVGTRPKHGGHPSGAGTLPYMAPEHLATLVRGNRLVSPGIDIYSLGVVLYE